ncbi:MAG: fibronectin type III domain-containing protein [Bacteroidota bacterium]
MEIVSAVPIVIDADFRDLGGNTIAQNGSNVVSNVPNAPDPTVVYVSSMGNSIAGEDLLPGQPDLIQTYNSSFNFYYGLDANPPANQTDFVTIVFHEIGHGMGITGASNGGQGVGRGAGAFPNTWDTFVELENGIPILDLPFGSKAQTDALVGGNLFINSIGVRKVLDNQRAKIFAPNPFDPGSSFSHWDEATFLRGDPNSLMTPFNSSGEAIHDLGDVTRAILRDMGWQLAPQEDFDVGIANVISPNSGQGLSNEFVSVVVGNVGIQDVSNIPVSYKLNDGDWVTEIMSTTIPPGKEVVYTFSTPVDLSDAGQTYTIISSVNILVDPNSSNNQTFKSVTHLLPITTFPYFENFENGAAQWVVEGDELWELGIPNGDIINSASDGNEAWVTNLEGNYPDETTSFLVSPVFDFTGKQDPQISMDIWYDIEYAWDGVSLQSSIDNGTTWITIGAFNDDGNWYTDGPDRVPASDGSEGDEGIDALADAVSNGNGWTGTGSTGSAGYIRAERELDGLGGETVIFRLVFASDQATNNEGFAFDNILIEVDDQGANDIGIAELISPLSGSLSSTENVIVRIENFGTEAASNFDVSYQIDNGIIITQPFTGSLSPGESQEFNFNATIDLSALQNYEVRVFTSLSNDEVNANDELTAQVQNFFTVSNYPYQESFEVNTGGWSSVGVNNSWAFGMPEANNAQINSASNGVNVWATNLSGFYNPDELSYLNSPGFNFTALTKPVLAFDLWSNADLTDGLYLEASSDNGLTWSQVNSESVLNWTNTTISQTMVWSGSSGGYRTSFVELPYAGEEFILLRFVFESDDASENEGFAIDNIRLSDLDNLSYSIQCPSDQNINTDSGQPFATLSLQNPSLENASGTVTITNSFTNQMNALGEYPVGENKVDFIVDVDGELAICQTTVTVRDNENPQINCGSEIIVSVPSGTNSAVVNYPLPEVSDNFGFLNQVTYSTSQIPDGESGVACPSGPNSFIRAFDLENDFDIESGFSLRSVDIGLQSTNVEIPSKINIYTLEALNFDINNSSDFVFNNLELVSSVDVTFAADLSNVLINVPIVAEIQPDRIVVVEFFTVLGSGDASNRNFFPGANPNQTGRSYLVGPGCGITEPSDVALVGDGFPDSQWVMNLNGFSASNGEPRLIDGIGSGGSFPLGSSQELYRVDDVQGNSNQCSLSVTVLAASLNTPVANAASSISNTGFTASWQSISGIQFYELFVSEDNYQTFLEGYNGRIISGTSEELIDLEFNRAYFYRVRAVNSVDPSQYSLFSNSVVTSTSISAPINLMNNEITDDSFLAVWQGITGIDEYFLDVSEDNFNTFVPGFDSRSVRSNQIQVNGLDANTEYQWRVRAVNAGGESNFSNISTLTTLPQIPNALSATGIEISRFTANWEDVGTPNYLIDVSTDNFQTFVANYEALETTGTSLIIEGLDPNRTYRYRVRAKITNGTLSLNSNSIRATTAPEVPVALEPNIKSTYAFVARWEESPNVQTYAIDVTNSDFSQPLPNFDDLLVFDNALLVNNLDAGTYSYRVRAINANGRVSDNSNIITVVVNESDPGQPSNPTATLATDIAPFSFIANWESQADAIFYELEVSNDNFTTLVELPVENVFGSSFLVEGLDDRTDYSYRVRAFNNVGKSGFSNVVSLTTVTGLDDHLSTQNVNVYPNPSSDKYHIDLSSIKAKVRDITLIDLNGRLASNKSDVKELGNNSYELYVDRLVPGIYTLRIETADGLIYKRVAKQ